MLLQINLSRYRQVVQANNNNNENPALQVVRSK